MKKLIAFLFLWLILFPGVFSEQINDEKIETSLEEGISNAGEKLFNFGENVNFYAEILGTFLLKFQELFMGILGFVSLNLFYMGGDTAFVYFMFFALLFMAIYSVVGFVFNKLNFLISFLITTLAFMGIGEDVLLSIFLGYEAMGIVLTVILPIIILLAFTFRIYQKAYSGKGNTSPFYAEMFNLVFLIFFGIFFIRYSWNKEGFVETMRFFGGWVLIALGIAQTVFYKIAANSISKWKMQDEKAKHQMKEMKKDATQKILEAQAGIDKL